MSTSALSTDRAHDGRIIITGGAGFVGHHLAAKFQAEGRDVVVIDNLSEHPLMPIVGELLHKDVASVTPDDLRGAACVYHLAAHKNVPMSFDQPVAYLSDLPAAANLLTAAVNAGVPRMVVTTTCEIFGRAERQPIAESAPLVPLSPYAAGKAAIDMLCRIYRQTYALKVTAVRLFNCFGPGERPDAVVPAFCNSVLSEGRVRIEGDGTQARDFTYISDITEALYRLHDQATGCVALNLGSGNTKNVRELADTALKLNGRGAIVNAPPRKQEIDVFRANNALAVDLLKWNPTVSFEDGFKETFAWWAKRSAS